MTMMLFGGGRSFITLRSDKVVQWGEGDGIEGDIGH